MEVLCGSRLTAKKVYMKLDNGASDQLYERLSKYFGILERNKYIVFEK